MNVSEEFLSEAVKHVADYFSFETWSMQKEEMKETIENYFGILIPVTVVGVIKGEKIYKSVYIKLAPHNINEKLKSVVRDHYIVEAFTYTTLIPMFKKESDIDIVVPDLYYASLEPNKEFLILENMSCNEYRRYVNKFLDSDHIYLALKALARFHSMSTVLTIKGKDPAHHLMHPYSCAYPPGYYEFIQLSMKNHLHLFESTPYWEYLKSLVTNLSSHVDDASSKIKHIVYGHGDYWRENFLFKYENNKPNEICLLDFQKCRKTSPAYDFLILLLTNLNSKDRLQNFQNFLETYVSTFRLCVDKHTLKVDYTLDDFNDDIKIVAPMCLATATMSFSLWLGLENDNFQSKYVCDDDSRLITLKSFKNIVCDMLKDLINLKYIKM
ncbi:hypothetical protein KGM_204671 [Danaus plexippus plexippus]|uniref:Uncharacterized protein n=1 Tax=Danaus plexippus plexippus TaxID=278856 RepID=A0A212FA36_DANPL|nr:hypothetical protein KGM_204671 [Danaus plexippus plexippus]